MKIRIVIILLFVFAAGMSAQTDRDLIRQGNRLYERGKFAEAEVQYRKAVGINANNPRALYDLGCALQQEGRDSDAIAQYELAVKAEPNVKVRSQGFYNMGVGYQRMKQYDKAIESYKECLRLNPSDDKARYNYVLCKRQQQRQQQNRKNGGQNNDKNQNNKKQDEKNKQDQKNKDKNKDQNKDNKRQDDNDMSRENAEQLLQAAMNKENETQRRLKQAMQQPERRQLDKNW